MSSDQVDVAVVGGGVAGLAAAWALRDRDVVVLESAERIGGRVRSDQWEGQPYHLGAQFLAGATSAGLLDTLGVQRVKLPKEGGLFLAGRRRTATATSLMRGLRVGAGGLADIAAVERESARVSGMISGLVDPTAPTGLITPSAVDLDARSFSEAIADRRPAVQSLYGVLVRSLTSKDPETLSALYAYAMLGSESQGGVGGANRARGGMQEVLKAFERALAGRIQTSAHAEAIKQTNGRVEITIRNRDRTDRVVAKACVVAVPTPEVRQIVTGLEARRLRALQQVRYGRFLSVALFLRTPVWRGEWAISCDLPVVSTLLNPAVLTGSGPSRVLSSYASDDSARQVWDLPDDTVADRFVTEIEQVFPGLRKVVCGADVRRWDPGYPAWEPGHLALLPQLAAPAGRIAFCGDYLSIPSIDGAIVTGLRAATEIKTIISRV